MSSSVWTIAEQAGVSHSLLAHFIGSQTQDLIIAKGSKIEIYPDGRMNERKVVFSPKGRIEDMLLIRQRSKAKDSLVIMTDQSLDIYDYEALRNDVNCQNIKTITTDEGQCLSGVKHLALVSTLTADGLFHIYELDKNMKTTRFELEYKNVRKFLVFDGNSIGFVHQTEDSQNEFTCLKHRNGSWNHFRSFPLEHGFETIIPFSEPSKGVIILGFEKILLFSLDQDEFQTECHSGLLEGIQLNTFAVVNINEFFLAGTEGHLYGLSLEQDTTTSCVTMNLQDFGETNIASTITQLKNGEIFVGSVVGDSLIGKLMDYPNNEKRFKGSVIHQNLSPLNDLVMVETDKQPKIITASGVGKHGSIRVLRNRKSFKVLEIYKCQRINGIYPLQLNPGTAFDTHILASTPNESFIYRIQDDWIQRIKDFDGSTPTLNAKTFGQCSFVQVTTSELRFITIGQDNKSFIVKSTWNQSNGIISNVSVDSVGRRVLLSSGNTISLISFQLTTGWQEENSKVFPELISCFDTTNKKATGTSSKLADTCALVALQSGTVVVIALPSLTEIRNVKYSTTGIQRLFAFGSFIISLDRSGRVHYSSNFNDEDGDIGAMNMFPGELCSNLYRLNSGKSQIFGCSIDPFLINLENGSVKLSAVSTNSSVEAVNTLNTTSFVNCMIFSDGSRFTIEKQCERVETIPMRETVNRIEHQPSSKTFGILTTRRDDFINYARTSISKCANVTSRSKVEDAPPDCDKVEPSEVSSFVLLDESFKALHSHTLLPYEKGECLLSGSFCSNNEPYYIVGTSFCGSDASNKKGGRLILFQRCKVLANHLRIINAAEFDEKPVSLQFSNDMIYVAFGRSIKVFHLTRDNRFVVEASFDLDNRTIDMKVEGSTLFVAGESKSLEVLSHDAGWDRTISRYNREDINQNITRLAMLSKKKALVCDVRGDMFVYEINSSENSATPSSSLSSIKSTNVRESPNLMTRSIGFPNVPFVSNTIIMGMESGTIQLYMEFDAEWSRIIKAIKAEMAATNNSVGVTVELENDEDGTIDAQVVRSLFDLPEHMITKVLDGVVKKVQHINTPVSAKEIRLALLDLFTQTNFY